MNMNIDLLQQTFELIRHKVLTNCTFYFFYNNLQISTLNAGNNKFLGIHLPVVIWEKVKRIYRSNYIIVI